MDVPLLTVGAEAFKQMSGIKKAFGLNAPILTVLSRKPPDSPERYYSSLSPLLSSYCSPRVTAQPVFVDADH